MKRFAAGFVVIMCVAAAMASAEEDDGIMGYYSGAIGGLPGEARIVALGNEHYKGTVSYSLALEQPITVRVNIDGEVENGVVKMSGEKKDSGAADITIRNGELTGTVKVGGDEQTFNLKRTIQQSPTEGMAPPEGAAALFQGDNLDAWQRWPLKWNLVDGAMEVVGSNLVTKEKFGDCTIHLEFRCPFMPKDRGQGRGNSGVYIMGRYEIQVLDSFNEDPAWDYCGGIYKQAVPRMNASFAPLTWQTYDIDFTAPKFDENGKKTSNARITVRHNGKVIHDDAELTAATPGGVSGQEAPEGPILLQDHNDAVRYRNVWVLKK